MEIPINFSIARNPLNWLTVAMMVLIAGIAIHLIADYYGVNPAGPTSPLDSPTLAQ